MIPRGVLEGHDMPLSTVSFEKHQGRVLLHVPDTVGWNERGSSGLPVAGNPIMRLAGFVSPDVRHVSEERDVLFLLTFAEGPKKMNAASPVSLL